jgi:hypothetical protein
VTRVAGYRVVLVIALHNLPKPGADFTRTMVLPVLKLCLDDIARHAAIWVDLLKDGISVLPEVGNRLAGRSGVMITSTKNRNIIG